MLNSLNTLFIMTLSNASTNTVSASLIGAFNVDITKSLCDLFHHHLKPKANAPMVMRCVFDQGICFTGFYEVIILWHFMVSLWFWA